MRPEQIARGGSDDDGPEAYKPWKVTGTKLGGTAVGLNIEDSRGVVYILKFDDPGVPEVETGAAVVGKNNRSWQLLQAGRECRALATCRNGARRLGPGFSAGWHMTCIGARSRDPPKARICMAYFL